MKSNVTPLPSLLTRLETKLRKLLGQRAENKEEFVEINVEFCVTLAQAREQFKADIEFGRWCDSTKLDVDHRTRAAAISMGHDPKALTKCLEATERRSLRHIYEEEFGRFTQKGKPKRRKSKPTPSPKAQPEVDPNDAEAVEEERFRKLNPGDDPAEDWYHALISRAYESAANAALTGPARNKGDWSPFKHKIDPALLSAVTEAAYSWKRVIAYLKELKKS